MQIHVVQSGESIWSIAGRYRVNPNQIVSANELATPNVLVVGQALVIPTPRGRHVVQPGESLWTIARSYGTTVQAILQANQITNPAQVNPGTVLRIPQVSRPRKEVNAYIERRGPRAIEAVRDAAEHLTYLTPFSYRVKADGSLTPLDDQAVLQAAREDRAAGLMAISNIADEGFSSELARSILSNTDVQDRLITNILTTMRTKGHRGLNIDFEYIFPDDRERYNQFLQRVVNRLRPEGYSVSSAVAPKLRANQPGLLYEAHDYNAHGRILDFVVLMTYEWGYSGGPPMAVAPIDQVRRVLDYAVTAIPRNKIMMGMPLYGYDWTLPYVKGGKFAETISPQEAIQRAARYNAVIQYDQRAQSPFYNYVDEQGREHEVWFEDARSVQAKFNTVKEYNLRGVSYWVLGPEFPQNWLVLEDHFRVRKII